MRVARKMLPVLMSVVLVVGLCPGLAFAVPDEAAGDVGDSQPISEAFDVTSDEEAVAPLADDADAPLVAQSDDADAPVVAQADDADAPLAAQASGYQSEFLSVVNSQPNGTGGSKYGLSSNWCARFVWKCAEWAGVSSNVIPHYDGCANMVNWFKNQGRWHSYTYTPKAGDLVFYNWSSSSGGAQHVGVVTGVSGKRVYTKEGNTYNGIVSSFSNRTAGVSKQGNGWAYIIGYASPNYVTPPPPHLQASHARLHRYGDNHSRWCLYHSQCSKYGIYY